MTFNMEENDETIEDIVKEMSDLDSHSELDFNAHSRCVAYAKRIEEAFKREMEAGSMCDMSCRESKALLEQYVEAEKRLFHENKELRKQLRVKLK